ncbi:MAG: hypothetical protein M3Q55_16445, partial [Acidobacteriota bacterium]|nr:hypothetical protein [Acidobacteriota bacterium]
MARKKTSDYSPRRFPSDSTFLKKARERHKAAEDADEKQTAREKEDILFEAGEQWSASALEGRRGYAASGNMPAIPERPSLVINAIKEPVRQVLNQERQSDIGIELVPADDFGDLGITPDDTEVTLREGLIRRIQRESIAADARTWAFKRSTIAGRGFYQIMTRFLPGKSWDQDVYVRRIFNQSSVKLDPAHEQPDGSDAEWAFVGSWMAWDRFAAEYPYLADGTDNPFKGMGKGDFASLSDEYPGWYQSSDESDERAVRITEYWYTVYEPKKLALLEDGEAMWAEDVPEGVTPTETRTVLEKQIKFCKIAGGILELEKTDWAGPDMPIVKVLGDEVLPEVGERRAEGIVRPARGAQVGKNYMISKFVETIGLTPIASLMVDPEAIEGYESWYAVSNTRALPYLPYSSFGDGGKQYAPPTRPNVDPNILPMANGIAMFDQFIKSTTAVPDSTLGNVDPALKSGRAIREVVANAQMSTSNFMDNLARSIRYEGQVINNLLYPIYGAKPG